MAHQYSMIHLAWVLVLAAVGCGSKVELRTVHGKPVDHWIDELKLPDSKARRTAIAALQGVGTSDQAAMPAIIDALKDRDAKVRDAAVVALLNIGPDAKDAVSALQEAENDKDATVRAHAVAALRRIEPGG